MGIHGCAEQTDLRWDSVKALRHGTSKTDADHELMEAGGNRRNSFNVGYIYIYDRPDGKSIHLLRSKAD